ncbi:integrase catalytic core [Lucifera butyrica]|uniref:Integrase catalytic core n=1 Tax=Lucifera butyrica TaxID=1351585 RepID=A0A498RFJ7_9FIRM|nr:DDE-type integrase/transposase/recombinase [Lucifera butyrica]VBB08862.1 integrase catalytic core [Lucifera butyrica]
MGKEKVTTKSPENVTDRIFLGVGTFPRVSKIYQLEWRSGLPMQGMVNLQFPAAAYQTSRQFTPLPWQGLKREKQFRLQSNNKPVLAGEEMLPKQGEVLGNQGIDYGKQQFRPSRPGEMLAQATFYMGRFKNAGAVYLYAVVDTYSFFAFGFLYTGKVPEGAVAILHNEVFPFYRARNIPVEAVQTDNGREFSGQKMHLFELYLTLSNIKHYKRLQSSGILEDFKQTVQNELFQRIFCNKKIDTIETLQQGLDHWLHYYNYERGCLDQKNKREIPIDRVKFYLADRKEKQNS